MSETLRRWFELRFSGHVDITAARVSTLAKTAQ